jgi:hypothetical protein
MVVMPAVPIGARKICSSDTREESITKKIRSRRTGVSRRDPPLDSAGL